MRFGSAAGNRTTERFQFGAKGLRVLDDLFAVSLKFGGLRIFERRGHPGDRVHMRAALERREDGAIDALRKVPLRFGVIFRLVTVFDLRQNETGARAAKHLVRGAGNDVAIWNRVRMDARDDKRVNMGNVGDQVSVDFLRDLGERGVIELERIRAHPGPNHFRTFAEGDFANFVHIETPGFLIRAIRDLLEVHPGEADFPAVREVPAVRNRNAHHLVARLQKGAINGAVRRGAGIRLNVGVFATEQFLSAGDREVFKIVDDFVPFVITGAGITFAIFVRKNRTAGFHHRRRGVTFRRDHFQRRVFHLDLPLNQVVNFRIFRLQIRITFDAHSSLLSIRTT